MLKISVGGKGGGFCDGIARRDFIRIGAMGIGGMTTANLLEAEFDVNGLWLRLGKPGALRGPALVSIEIERGDSTRR